MLPIAVGIYSWYGTPGRNILALHTQTFVTNSTLIHLGLIPCFIFLYVGLDIFIAGTFDPHLPSGYAVSLTYTLFGFLVAKHRHLIKRNSLLVRRSIFGGRLFLILSVVFVVGSHDSILLIIVPA
ncbi:MAG: hypothetical protein PHD65_07825 [Gallionella sp.]|nr:hypothetical protein [Gallionella sp.]